MPWRTKVWIWVALGVGLALTGGTAQRATSAVRQRRMSFHNRLLMNRAAVSHLRTVEVMLLDGGRGLAPTRALVESLGGRILRTYDGVGYMRAEVPTEKLLTLVDSDNVEAYQISSMSKATWYRDGAPQSNAEMHRGFEVLPPESGPTAIPHADLPLLSPQASRQSGYTADDDAGVGDWLRLHPTFDGRGVTIALLESGQAALLDPTLGAARTLDGRDVPKLAGILNTIDPDEPDETRVSLDTLVKTETSWTRVGARTYILPGPGAYRLGVFALPAGSNLIHQFGVIENEATKEIRVDTNGDASFQDETPIDDVNEHFDPRALKLTYPQQRDLSFVIARGRRPHTVNVYVASGSHQAMTLSVAAGSRSDEGLAYGVAPGARVLLVRTRTIQYRLDDLIEGYLEIARRSDVDIFCDSYGIEMVPDTADDFAGLVFRRLVATYGKPVIHGAGNMQLILNSATALGDGFSVGGSIGPATFAALYGGGAIDRLLVHPLGSAGPSLDGAIKPDFLAPMHRIAADLPGNLEPNALPKNAPAFRLPRGYQISCCTSASSPYAAGVAALLLSAARQEHVPYSLAILGRALRIGARFQPDFPSYQQGNGVLDVSAAWRELTRAIEIPRIATSAAIVHPLAQYAAGGTEGQGIFEFEGWKAGLTGRREIRFRRESGPSQPVTYRLSWTGNDGTFATVPSVTLPLNAPVAVPVTIGPHSAGAHGALLNVHDPATDAIVYRTQATIVASESVDSSTGSTQLTGTLPLMRMATHYVQVPNDVGMMSLKLRVIRGSVRPTILPNHGLLPSYYQHLYPSNSKDFTQGDYTLIVPHPADGVWTVSLVNDSALLERDPALTSGEEAEYAITAQVFRASLHPAKGPDGAVSVDIRNVGSALREPVLEVSTGTFRSHDGAFLRTGMPNQIDIAVPEGAATLALHLRGATPSTGLLELYLYDCTTGECFSDDLAFPAAKTQTIVVRRPKAGRWVAAVNAAPFPAASGGFVLDEIITTGAPRRASVTSRPRDTGARWTETVDVGARPPSIPGATRIFFLELIDLSIERDQTESPWGDRNGIPLRNRPAALGTAVYRFE